MTAAKAHFLNANHKKVISLYEAVQRDFFAFFGGLLMPQILLDFTHAAHNKLTLVPVTASRKTFIILGVQGMDPAIQKQGSRRVFHLVSGEWNIDEWRNFFLFFVHRCAIFIHDRVLYR